MIRGVSLTFATGGLLTLFAFISVIFFPWLFTAAFALFASAFIPFIPLAVGIFADTLYYSPATNFVPLFTLYGALATGIVVLVHRRLRTGII